MTPADREAFSAPAPLAVPGVASDSQGLSAAELVQQYLERIELWQPKINAFVTVTGDLAERQARATDEALARHDPRGLVEGMIVAVKDDIDVAGVRCTVGSTFFRDRIPSTDAEVVARLVRSGAIVIGKAGLSEFALGSTSDNAHWGPVRNPWDPARYPGGSSGGPGAALAADLCEGALGSDAGGSVRVPAALCGVSGLRPTYGLIPPVGSMEIAPSIETIGPMARSVTDVARLFAVISQPAGDAPKNIVAADDAVGIEGLTIGLPKTFFLDDVEEDVGTAVSALAADLASLGARVREIELPTMEPIVEAVRIILVTEAFALHESRLIAEPDGYGTEVRTRMLLGKDVGGAQLARAYSTCREWTRTLSEVWRTVDIILTPTVGFCAKPFEGAGMIAETAKLTRLTVPFSCTGVPSLSIPCGFSDGLPIGAQLVAPRHRDDMLLRVGIEYQKITDWHRRRPNPSSWWSSRSGPSAAPIERLADGQVELDR